METPAELIKLLGQLHSSEKEEIMAVINDLNDLYKTKEISEETIQVLDKCEDVLRLLKSKYVSRIIRLYRANIKV